MIMKKIFNIAFAAAAMSALAVSCQTENLEPQTPQEEAGKTITINASLSDVTKAAFSDGDGLKWEEGDKVQYCGAVQGIDVSAGIDADNSYNATFSISNLPSSGSLWLLYNSDNQMYNKQEFRKFFTDIVQTNAGTINKDYIQLLSEKIDLSSASADGIINTKMKIVGTLARFLVYSRTGKYASENVQSVELIASDGTQISGKDGGLIGYNLETEKYIQNSDGEQGDDCVVYYWQNSNIIRTTLTNSLPLDGLTEATQNTGIYMPLPPVTISGYKYIVTTDKATYTFDASSTSCTFKENIVKNVPLNLENSKVTRVAHDAIKGELKYVGNLDAFKNTIIPAAGYVNFDPGSYWYAQVQNTGSDVWSTRENRTEAEYDGTPFYSDVNFKVTDENGNEITWLRVTYKPNDTHWLINADANDGAERKAIVTATFDSVDGYIIQDDSKTVSATITQASVGSNPLLVFQNGLADKVISNAEATYDGTFGYLLIFIDGVSINENKSLYPEIYSKATISVEYGGTDGNWLTCDFRKDADNNITDASVVVNANKNTSGVDRVATVTITWPDTITGYDWGEAYSSAESRTFSFKVTQSYLDTVE